MDNRNKMQDRNWLQEVQNGIQRAFMCASEIYIASYSKRNALTETVVT